MTSREKITAHNYLISDDGTLYSEINEPEGCDKWIEDRKEK